MQHHLPIAKLGPKGPSIAKAVEACVHCGFCLPTCPTYRVLGEEMDSPRGRIVLIKGMLEGEVDLEDGLPFIDRCLGCVSCETACPSGVAYGALLTSFRAHAEERRQRPMGEKFARRLLLLTLTRPRILRLATRLAVLGRRPLNRFVQPHLPPALGQALDLLPRALPKASPLPSHASPQGTPRARVALFPSCAPRALQPGIDEAALRVLVLNGVEVLIPQKPGCCGALALHAGEETMARSLSRAQLQAFPEDLDAILTTAAGCGSGLRETPSLWAGQAEEKAARRLAEKVEDISTFLGRLGLVPPPALDRPLPVVYHDACHLAHAQRERQAPRALLRSIEGLELREPKEWELCCGSAGIYNLEQPEIARDLGERKVRNLLATDPQMIVAANIGCGVQIAHHLRRQGRDLPILHPVEVLDRAYRREL